MITVTDIELALHFLKKVVARGAEEELLLSLIDKMEKESQRCRKNNRSK